jgi:hypothetical protein
MTIESWSTVRGYESIYEVSSFGRVYSIDKNKILAHDVGRKGYHRVTLCKNGVHIRHLVHRLVLSNFIRPPSDKEESRHLDGDRGNNHLANLAWGTAYDNANDSIRHGTRPQGDAVYCSKITNSTARLVRKFLRDGGRQKQIAEHLCLPVQIISNIKTWHTYACAGDPQ